MCLGFQIGLFPSCLATKTHYDPLLQLQYLVYIFLDTSLPLLKDRRFS